MLASIAITLAMTQSSVNLTALEANPLVTTLGRWHWERDTARAQWPATGLDMQFRGSKLFVDLEDNAPGGEHPVRGENSNQFNLVINGKVQYPIILKPGKNRYSLVDAEKPGEFSIQLTKRTESHVGWVRWHGISYDAKASLKPPKRLPRLDFYGDSDACGYGVETTDKDENFSPTTENADLAFAAVAAKKLKMELNLIAASGWGIYRGYGGETDLGIPLVHRLALVFEPKTEVANISPPAAIVVMLGDNDFAKGDPGSNFDATYTSFVSQLRKESPKVPILLCVGTSMTDNTEKQPRSRVKSVILEIIKETKDKNIHLVEITPYDGEREGYGADWHTSRIGHWRIGSEMAIAISQALKKRKV